MCPALRLIGFKTTLIIVGNMYLATQQDQNFYHFDTGPTRVRLRTNSLLRTRHYNEVTLAVENSSCTLFADHYSDGDINKASNCINRDLDNISSWLSSNQMVVHPGKSEVMKIGSQRSLKSSNDLNIFIHDHRLWKLQAINILVSTSIVPWLGKSIFHICRKERIQKSVL